jgi:tRNA (guanine-N7-)-methyltransferase
MTELHSAAGPNPHRFRALAPRAPEGPLDLAALLPGRGPIELEIGFGHGLFLYERARARPDVRLLGLEVKKKWSYLVAERCQRRGLLGVTVWSEDARAILPRVQAASVQRVFMHFPDPWWKKRHEHRSLTGDVLLTEIAQVLVAGGEFFMQTDVEQRAEAQLAALRAHPAFELASETGYLAHNPYQARSNREARAMQDGLPVYRVLAIRRAASV